MKVSDGISLKAQSILGESLLNPQQLQTIDIIPLKQIGELQDCNKINNAKYKIYTFLPLVLYYQFQHFFNFYFLILTITQFIPALKVGFLINYVGPLSLVILFSILKEAHDDIKRHQRDRQINNQIYQVVTQYEIINIKAGQLDVGMIVQVDQNQTIPADLLILKTNTKEGHVFIRTDQLDGETDWKLRKPVQITDQQEINNLQGFAVVEQPSSNIYQFRGIYDCEQPESLSLENVVWASTVLATGSIFGLVIYTGRQTRMQLNQKQPNTKLGIFDKEIDKLSKQLFLIMVILSFIITFFSSPPLDFIYIIQYFTRYLILVSSIIPISMRVNLEFAKLKFSIQINKDKQIEGTITRNSNIPESLGRIQYLLSDKTGTLTQNDMIFKKLSMEMRTYTHEQIRSIKEILVEQNRINKYPLTSKTKDAKVRDLITCFSVCHNVTPIDQDDGQRLYQAQSPDEIALVKFTEQLGYIINNRTEDQISLTVSNNNKETYQILQCFPFSSETKRMGIIVQFGEKIIFYLKGADIIMRQFLPEQQKGFVDEECENLAREGLRTLVMCQRELSKQFYNEWLEKYEESQKIIINREKAVQKVIEVLEDNMEFIGITGVEDKLQEDVAHTIENLRNAGIHVWMLTGDKMETAICIAILSGLKYPYQSFTTMKEVQDEIQMNMLLENFENNPNVVLVIDGTSLQTALKYFKKEFIMVAMKCPAVICCRCSPTQKSEITELLRQFSQKVVACIGDGGNDVGMIQSADVGIGIEGKEGKQAALASDFSILKFNALNLLLLWHGRLSYRRSALLSQFIVHRGLLISVVQAIFIFVFYFLSISLFSGILMLGYSTIFTMFPVFCIIYDEDVKQDIALKFPPLYKSLQQGRFLNTKTFLTWTWKALYQGFIIMLCSLLFFKQSFLKIETTVFTCLIFTQYAMTLTELDSIHIVMIIANILSAMVYLLTLYMIPEHLNISEVFDWSFFGWVMLILLISWAPLYVSRWIYKKVDPTDSEKLMKNVKRQIINTEY